MATNAAKPVKLTLKERLTIFRIKHKAGFEIAEDMALLLLFGAEMLALGHILGQKTGYSNGFAIGKIVGQHDIATQYIKAKWGL